MAARPPTVLLVHGAHLGGWCWLLVIDQLGRRGIDARAVDLPLTSYRDDVEAVRAAIGAVRSGAGAVHVVGHSYAGLPVSEAGHDAVHLTFVAGRLPRPGEPPAELTCRWRTPELGACMRQDASGVVRLTATADQVMFHRTSPVLTAFAMPRLRPMASTVPELPLDDPAWTSVPSSYVVCSDDRAVRPDHQRARAGMVGSSIELDTDHSPFFSNAAGLAEFIADRHRATVAG